MAVSCEIYRAEWEIPYPAGCDAASLPGFLRPLTHVEHELESFPWPLVVRMKRNLEEPAASFEHRYFGRPLFCDFALIRLSNSSMRFLAEASSFGVIAFSRASRHAAA